MTLKTAHCGTCMFIGSYVRPPHTYTGASLCHFSSDFKHVYRSDFKCRHYVPNVELVLLCALAEEDPVDKE